MSFATELQGLKDGIKAFRDKISTKFNNYILKTAIGAVDGVAPLDSNGLIPDDYLRGTFSSIEFAAAFVEDLDITLFQAGVSYAIGAYNLTEVRAGKYFIHAQSASGHQITEIIVGHNGTTPYIMEYGTILMNGTSIVTLDAAISGGTLNINAVGAAANTRLRGVKQIIRA